MFAEIRCGGSHFHHSISATTGPNYHKFVQVVVTPTEWWYPNSMAATGIEILPNIYYSVWKL